MVIILKRVSGCHRKWYVTASKKMKQRNTARSSDSTARHGPCRMDNRGLDTRTPALTATRYLRMDERARRMWSVQTMDYDSASRRKETVTHTMAWMNMKTL